MRVYIHLSLGLSSVIWFRLVRAGLAVAFASLLRNPEADLELGAAGRSREGNDIADVRYACDEHQHPLET